MDRRNFGKTILLTAPVLANPFNIIPTNDSCKRKIKPNRLKKGDTIGLITPGSYISDEGLDKAVKNMEDLGFQVKLAKNIRKMHGFIAGTDKERLSDIHDMFSDKTIDGIWCARGGYGTTRLLPFLNYKLIKQNPKVLIGYSDITALANAIFLKSGLICFHGPVGASTFTDYALEHLNKILIEPESNISIENFKGDEENEKHELKVITEGRAKGKIVGGNLSLLAALAGTPYEPDYKNKIVFIEDIGEKPYRIDRMLTQLRQSGKLYQATGILLGRFEDCNPDEDDNSLTLEETLIDRLGDLNIPLLSGFSFGHISNQITIPIGIEAGFDTDSQMLTFYESGVN